MSKYSCQLNLNKLDSCSDNTANVLENWGEWEGWFSSQSQITDEHLAASSRAMVLEVAKGLARMAYSTPVALQQGQCGGSDSM